MHKTGFGQDLWTLDMTDGSFVHRIFDTVCTVVGMPWIPVRTVWGRI